MNFQFLKQMSKPIKPTPIDLKFFTSIINETTDLFQLLKQNCESGINKVNSQSNLSTLQTFNFSSFANQSQNDLWTSKLISRHTTKSKITNTKLSEPSKIYSGDVYTKFELRSILSTKASNLGTKCPNSL